MNTPSRQSHDFEATIRILTSDEGGRKTPAYNGIRWDFAYADDEDDLNLFMIYPEFVDEYGTVLPHDLPLPVGVELSARMTVLVDEMRSSIHRSRITIGTKFYCCEGPHRVAEGVVKRINALYQKRGSH